MSATILRVTDAVVQFALGEDEPTSWTGEDSYECQVIEARIQASQVTTTAPATYCQGETDSLGLSKFSVVLQHLQDWTVAKASGGLSQFLWDNDAAVGWVRISIPTNESGDAVGVAVANVQFSAADFSGPAGTPLEATTTLPCLAKPEITTTTVSP